MRTLNHATGNKFTAARSEAIETAIQQDKK